MLSIGQGYESFLIPASVLSIGQGYESFQIPASVLSIGQGYESFQIPASVLSISPRGFGHRLSTLYSSRLLIDCNQFGAAYTQNEFRLQSCTS